MKEVDELLRAAHKFMEIHKRIENARKKEAE